MKNEKILCRHCGRLIGFSHHLNEYDYKSNVIISPNKYGTISQSKIRGVTKTQSYGDYNTEIGYVLETQLKCNKCNKKTSIKTVNYY